jgi:hypothetical protein
MVRDRGSKLALFATYDPQSQRLPGSVTGAPGQAERGTAAAVAVIVGQKWRYSPPLTHDH